MNDSVNKDEKNDEVKPVESEPSTDWQKAASDYKNDMFKYKDQMKAMKEEMSKLQEEKSNKERESLEKNQEWKALYEREQIAKKAIQTELTENSNKWYKSAKVNAVVQRLGGFKKDSYSRFIDADNVLTNPDDGTIIEDSLAAEVNRLKQNFPELLKGSTVANLPNDAASRVKASDISSKDEIAKLSKAELLKLYEQNNKK